MRGVLLWASGVGPYLIYALATGTFSWRGAGVVAAVAGVLALWYVLLPHRPWADLLFIVVVAALFLTKPYAEAFARPAARVRIDVLGQLMTIRLGIAALLWVRQFPGVGFGFWPRREEWARGLLYFACFLPVGFVLGWALRFLTPRADLDWLRAVPLAAATFFGVLWVLALSEEFFFRGVMQALFVKWMGLWPGIVVASVVFGLGHLPFRQFPNWPFALLATLAGVFYGHAFVKAKSIRAPMVTHALVVTAWRVFLS